MKTAVVIGGGITGLTAMRTLQKYKRKYELDLNLLLVERDDKLGGKIQTVKKDDFIMETGADSIVARHESVMPLIKDLDLENKMVYNATGISYIYTKNELHPIPQDSLFGIPMSTRALFSSTLVSRKGKMQALRDFVTTNEHYDKNSSVGSFLRRFLGKEIVENQIAPVLSGVYSGDLDKLTLASTLPYLLDYKNEYGSIIKGLAKNRAKFQSGGNKKFISFEGGMATLIDRLEEVLVEDVEILKGAVATKILKKAEKYELTFANHRAIEADYIILAAPHDAANTLLNDYKLEGEFNQFKNSSLISIYAGFEIPDEKLPADGTGFIVDGHESVMCDACTWTSRKWTHTSKKHQLLFRLFYKSSNPAFEQLKSLSKDALEQVALKDIEKSLGITGKPTVVEVTNWKELMPNYHLQHNHAVKTLEDQLTAKYPNLYLAGASYYGVGIGACIQNGIDTADKIVNQLI
ncbi:protoporphyrinogen oxidase [Falsibacillus albus]|uniref:Coproporphyrinogen III oxidase n=1 Tax=Falsibacillus albus TaxID=2478915 RepID=A0A3L7JZL8_9BACI|nr:protoporphyrinogen oxidase [Falsibacillus albus]RLQ96308.1 protoporphyrinogen oxidase [Falsibacillus albus]